MENETQKPGAGWKAPDIKGQEPQELSAKQIEDFVLDFSGEEIDRQHVAGNIEMIIKIGWDTSEVKVENKIAFFDIPIDLDMQNEDEYRNDDRMVLKYQVDLANNTIKFLDKVDGDGKPFKGDLDQWEKDVKDLVEDKFEEKFNE